MNEPAIDSTDNISDLQATVAELIKTIKEQHAKINEQDLLIKELTRMVYGHRRERFIPDGDEPTLFADQEAELDATAANPPPVEEIIVDQHKRRRRKDSNDRLPDHLERYEVIVAAPPEVANCPHHGPRTLLGYDRTETLEIQRPRLRVRVTLYPNYTCKAYPACGVAATPKPEGLVEGNRYDSSVAATIITQRYAFHLPYYRQEDVFAGSGWTPSRSTLINIATAAADKLAPLITHWQNEVIAGGLIGTDETAVRLIVPRTLPTSDPSNPRSERIREVFAEAVRQGRPTVSGRMWVYRALQLPLDVFDFTVSRHRDGPDQFLLEGGFAGILQADCYRGYESLVLRSDSRIVRAACVAHARRKILEASESHPVLATLLLTMFVQLYDIEDRAATFDISGRQELRAREARRIWQRMAELLASDAVANVLPKEPIAKAIGYLHNHWSELQVYITDGRLPIDNNEVEQLMKKIATGRKNWLFVGSVAAGQRAACLFSLVSSAARCDLDVWAYVKDVLDQLLAGSTDYDALRPDRWAATHPEFIRTYRQNERRDRADRKRVRRAHRRSPAD